MKAIFRKYFIVLLCIFCMGVSVAADELPNGDGTSFQPLNLYISTTSENMSISNGIATCTASVRATSSISEVIITAKLQKYQNGSWVTQENFPSEVSYTYYGALSRTCSVTPGYSYRLVVTYQALIGGVSVETVNKTYDYGLYM